MTVLTPELEARILEATRCAPTDGAIHWSRRKLAAHLDVSHMMVARERHKHGPKPHRIERYMASNNPDLEKKAADIIGLYLNPPAHAARKADGFPAQDRACCGQPRSIYERQGRPNRRAPAGELWFVRQIG
jgi:hypothetical protein